MKLRILRIIDNFNRIALWDLVIQRANTLNLYNFHLLCSIAVVAEDERTVFGHSLLANDGSLTTLNNEVAAEIFRTFTEGARMKIVLITQETIVTTNHYWNLSKMNIGKYSLANLFDSSTSMVNHCSSCTNIYE